MENTMNEQAAAARAAQDNETLTATAISEMSEIETNDLKRCQIETLIARKNEGIPLMQDGTPYTYEEASSYVLDNCNRQLSNVTPLKAVWAGKTLHNGNVMYKMEGCGLRLYYYRDLCKILGAPSQRADKSEAGKARKAAAQAAAAALAQANAETAAQAAAAAQAQEQAQRYMAALQAAAKDGTPAEEVLAHLQAEDAANALAKARHDMTMDLSARGYDPDDIVVLVDHKLPLPAKPSETAPITANGTKEVQVTSQPGKAAAKAQKGTKKGNK